MSQNKNEAFSRVLIDAMLMAQGWNVTDPNAVLSKVAMPVNPPDGAQQAKSYAENSTCPMSSSPMGQKSCSGNGSTKSIPTQSIFALSRMMWRGFVSA